MPWRMCDEMEERLKFIAEALPSEANISEICRKYGISRSLGYKLLGRYREEGVDGLKPRSRRPHSNPNQVSAEIVCEVIKARTQHPSWGGDKIHTLLLREYEAESVPSVRSVERVLENSGLSRKKRKRKPKSFSTQDIVQSTKPNHVWTVDFKGEWKMGNGKYVYPLTIRDDYSKYILDIQALPSTGYEATKHCFYKCFQKYGLPQYIRSDNGNPFASVRAIQGLSRLSVWWLKAGVLPNRIPPSSPQLNGAHERMHKDMKKELQCDPQRNLKAQQEAFDEWRREYDYVRPHAALKKKCPADVYRKSRKRFDANYDSYCYPRTIELRKVCNRGMFSYQGKRLFLSHALVGEFIGLKNEEHDRVSVWFNQMFLTYLGENRCPPRGAEGQV